MLALAAAVVLAVGVGGYMLLRAGHGRVAPRGAAESGPSLEHATTLFQEGKLNETVAELRQIAPSSPDYARAQKLLASLTRKGDASGRGRRPVGLLRDGREERCGRRGSRGAQRSAPEALRQRQEAEKAFAEKRYIESLTAFNLAAPAFQQDPSFTQSLGAAAEKVSELTPAVKLYNEGEYETAIPILWRIYQEDRDNKDARSYLLRRYYNQGIDPAAERPLLQGGRELQGSARRSIPSDADAIRAREIRDALRQGRPRPDGPHLRPPRATSALEPSAKHGRDRPHRTPRDFPLRPEPGSNRSASREARLRPRCPGGRERLRSGRA